MKRIIFKTKDGIFPKNKLNDFSMIRLSSEKYSLGEDIELFIDDIEFTAEVVSIFEFNFKNIDTQFYKINTGFNKESFKRLIQKTYPDVIFETQELVFVTISYSY